MNTLTAKMLRNGTLLLLCTLILGACGSLVATGANRSGTYTEADERNLNDVSEDAAVTRRVREVLINHNIQGVNVTTVGGMVYLTGRVTSSATAEAVITDIRRVRGVSSVDSALRYPH